MTKKTAVLGFGNPVRADDGVGIYVIEQLKDQLEPTENISIFDMGTSAFEVLFKLKGHDRIILVDAVLNSQEPVGTTFKLPASEIEGQIEDDPMVFLHSLKWNQALSYAKKMLGNEYPQEIEVYLIAIDSTRFNVGMSEEAKRGGDKIVKLLLDELKN
ncbi:MAG TPA: hydrogenase maturation protease [Bacteroidetes bacterium]|nr:hydrogenase maturation protease [Bacteroidota bacterium]